MKTLTTEFLRSNPTGTACGRVGNKALSNPIVLHLIDTYFGGEISVDGIEDGVAEIKASTQNLMSREELDIFCEDKDLKRWLKQIFGCKIKKIYIGDEHPNKNVIGAIFDFYVNSAFGCTRYDGVYDGVLYFEVE